MCVMEKPTPSQLKVAPKRWAWDSRLLGPWQGDPASLQPLEGAQTLGGSQPLIGAQ